VIDCPWVIAPTLLALTGAFGGYMPPFFSGQIMYGKMPKPAKKMPMKKKKK